MIVAPQRRIVLYAAGNGVIEILVLGSPESVATMHALVRVMLEAWRGFWNVGTIAMGSAAIGLRAQLSNEAAHDDVLAEALRMLRASDAPPAVAGSMAWRGHTGYVATW